MNWKNVLNAVLFQTVWFAAVLGAARGIPWFGLLVLLPVVTIHMLLCSDRRGEAKLLLTAGVAGFLFDTVLTIFGIFIPHPWLFPAPLSPPWMIGLWLNFAATLNYSLGWLRGRLFLAVLFGAVGGPLAYYSGARLGATATIPGNMALMFLAIGWGAMTPLLVTLASRFHR